MAVLPKRGGVERSFSWLRNFRGLSKDSEILPQPHSAKPHF